jgi:hypothetical protein
MHLAKFTAAPDRWRRRRWAQHWLAARTAKGESQDCVEQLATEGFSHYQLQESTLRHLMQDWQALKELKSGKSRDPKAPKTTGKVFFEELLSEQDLAAFPGFLAAALDEEVLAAVLEAIGMAPHLESVDILASTPTGPKLTASQLWHYDVNDVRIIKLFVYLEDCTPRHGPFTFIPADRSQRVAHAVGHYVNDDHIAKHVPREQWRTVEGQAGTAFLIDTGRCYHFGSRCEAARYAYVATYSSGLKFMRRSKLWRKLLRDRTSQLSPLQQTVCGAE